MKEMVYGERFKYSPLLLARGEYEGFNYYILSLGTHPTAYVEIPKEHKFFGKHYDDCPVECHCGLTYSESELPFLECSPKYKCLVKSVVKDTWIVGWDYAHLGDFTGYMTAREILFYKQHEGLKQWTTAEIFEEVKEVINQIRELK